MEMLSMYHLTESDDDLLLRASLCRYHWYLKSTSRWLKKSLNLLKAHRCSSTLWWMPKPLALCLGKGLCLLTIDLST